MKHLKLGLLRGLKQTGAFSRIVESQWRRQKLLILCYHGLSIEDEHEWKPDSNITESLFESRLDLLRSGGYSVLPLEDALKKVFTNTLPPKSVVITFDDGLHNFYARAYPLLRKYNFPATLYLTTYYCGHQQPVFPLICSYMLWKKRGVTLSANPGLGLSHPLDLTTSLGRNLAWKEIQIYAGRNNLNANQKNELAKGLAQHLNLDFDTLVSKRLFHLMTPEEVKEVSNHGVDIQLHAHRHRTPMDRLLFQNEIADNRRVIEDLIGSRVRHYCYPSGVHRPQFLPWLSEQGVTSATTCDQGLADMKTNPLLLPRFLDSMNVSPIEFESWLTGVGSFVPRNPIRRWPPFRKDGHIYQDAELKRLIQN